jgi:hypothetical protein
VKNNSQFCTSCKHVGHKEHDYKNKKSHANVSSIRFVLVTCLLRVQMV